MALTAITLQAIKIMASQKLILNAKHALRIQIYSLFIKYVTVIGGFILIFKFINIPNFQITIIGFGLVLLTFLISPKAYFFFRDILHKNFDTWKILKRV